MGRARPAAHQEIGLRQYWYVTITQRVFSDERSPDQSFEILADRLNDIRPVFSQQIITIPVIHVPVIRIVIVRPRRGPIIIFTPHIAIGERVRHLRQRAFDSVNVAPLFGHVRRVHVELGYGHVVQDAPGHVFGELSPAPRDCRELPVETVESLLIRCRPFRFPMSPTRLGVPIVSSRDMPACRHRAWTSDRIRRVNRGRIA